jgi:SCP1.201-like deaminase
MPFDPATAFRPADPGQWWRTRALPPTLVQPNAPGNGASGNAAGADGIDDWIVPGQAPKQAGSPGVAPASAGSDPYPDDWIYPDGWNAPPAASPGTAPPAPSPRHSAANPGISNQSVPPTDPFAAYWSMIPASRLGAVAWAPPIFPDAFGRFHLTPPAPAPLDVAPTTISGLLGGIARMLAASSSSNVPATAATDLLGAIARLPAARAVANVRSDIAGQDLLGAIARLPAASAPLNVRSDVAAQGLVGAIAKLQGTNTDAPASLLGPRSGAADQPPSLLQRLAGLGWTSTATGPAAASNYLPVNGVDANQQRSKYIARDPTNRSYLIERASAHGLSELTPLENSTAEPNSIRTAQADVPGSPGMVAPALRAAVAAGQLTEEEAAILQQRANALGAGRDERLHAAISTGLPKFDGKTTYGVLITNEGDVVPLQSAGAHPLYDNYVPAGHVEGKAAIWIRENGSTGGVLYHNNPAGTCGFCNSQLKTLLPKGAKLRVVPPGNAVPKNAWAREGATEYEGNDAVPKDPPSNPQLNLFGGQP